MEKARVYIASSEQGNLLAETLRDALAEPYCEARTWKDVISQNRGKTKVEILEQISGQHDFAVIILGKDDVEAKVTDEMRKARDDCIFEAGLFMASVGRNRCFLVCSAGQDGLPKDLSGIEFLPFDEPTEKMMQDRAMCKQAMQGVVSKIKDMVQPMGQIGRETRSLTKAALLERERRAPAGDLEEDQVVVSSDLPLETKYGAAWQIKQNIDDNIKYVYFFQGSDDGAEQTCILLQQVLVAGVLGQKEGDVSFRQRCDCVKQNQQKILEELKWICCNDYIKVYFLPSAPELKYCIHNASNSSAKMYVKHRNEFIEWESGGEALQFWRRTQQRRHVGDSQPDDGCNHAIFYGVYGFDVSNFKVLERLVAKYFSGGNENDPFGKEVYNLCLKGPHEMTNLGTGRG